MQPMNIRPGTRRPDRAIAMGEQYIAGSTLQEIGDFYGLTRERVRQILSFDLGLTKKDGGQSVKAEQKRQARIARRDRISLHKYGMTIAERKEVSLCVDIAGISPHRRYGEQERNAALRDIEWNLLFSEWWAIWTESGKWSQRTRGKDGYVMSRYGDQGPYAVGNVRIIRANDNNSEYIRRHWKEVNAGTKPYPSFCEGFRGSKYAYGSLDVGQTITIDRFTAKREGMRNNAINFAKSRGWKITTSMKKNCPLTITRIS